MADQFLFSGEPLPLAPEPSDDPVELANFHRKLLDYLRRLTEKVSAPEVYEGGDPVGALETFASAIAANQEDIAADTLTPIEWTDPIRCDAAYTHDATSDPEKITINDDGFYLVIVNTLGSDAPMSLRAMDIDGNVLGYGFAHTVLTELYLSIALPMHFTADTILRIAVEFTTGPELIDANYTRITILKLGSLEGTGSVPGVDPTDTSGWWAAP